MHSSVVKASLVAIALTTLVARAENDGPKKPHDSPFQKPVPAESPAIESAPRTEPAPPAPAAPPGQTTLRPPPTVIEEVGLKSLRKSEGKLPAKPEEKTEKKDPMVELALAANAAESEKRDEEEMYLNTLFGTEIQIPAPIGVGPTERPATK